MVVFCLGLKVTGSLSPFVPMLVMFHTEIGISRLFPCLLGCPSWSSYRLVYRCVRLFGFMLYRFCHRHLPSPFWRGLFCLALLLCVVSCLDEDCNPGRGDCGRPLRLFVIG